MVIRAYLLGMVSVLPVILIEYPFQTLKAPLFSIIIAAPVIEEIAKFSMVRIFIFNNTEFDEPMDGIVYGASVALGFASVENCSYLFASKGNLMPVFIARAVLSVPGHALCSSMWGYGLGQAKFASKEYGKRYIRNGLILAVVSHAVFNLFASLSILGGLALLSLVGTLWFLILRRIKRVEARSPFHK